MTPEAQQRLPGVKAGQKFGSVTLASRAIGVDRPNVSRAFRNQGDTASVGGVTLRYARPFRYAGVEPWRVFIHPNPSKYPVWVNVVIPWRRVNQRGDLEMGFKDSLVALGHAMGVNPVRLAKALWEKALGCGRVNVTVAGVEFRLADDEQTKKALDGARQWRARTVVGK
jgi:hypothetical protein